MKLVIALALVAVFAAPILVRLTTRRQRVQTFVYQMDRHKWTPVERARLKW